MGSIQASALETVVANATESRIRRLALPSVACWSRLRYDIALCNKALR